MNGVEESVNGVLVNVKLLDWVQLIVKGKQH